MIAAGLYKQAASLGIDADWRANWPSFKPAEFACHCGRYCKGEYFHDPAFLDGLQRLRDAMGAPLKINSGRRCALHNAAVGGAALSMHKQEIAADISLAGHDPVTLARQAIRARFRGLGFGASFLHVDMRSHPTAFHYPGGKAAWTRRFGFDPVQQFKQVGEL